jgi:hypothetical protein
MAALLSAIPDCAVYQNSADRPERAAIRSGVDHS